VTTANRGGSARWTAEPPFESEPTTESSSVGSHATSSVASHAAPAKPGRARSVYGRWRAWRKSRPFVGALLAILGGTEILLAISAPLPVVIHFGVSNLIGFALPILIILCGLMLWFAPHPRAFYAMLILLSSLATWLTSNFGGFFLGMLLGIIGGSLALSWSPDKGPKRSKKAAEAATELD
jgi:hypothetical protein